MRADMSRDKAMKFRVAIVGLIFTPLVFAFSATEINKLHLSVGLPFSLPAARILSVTVTILILISIPFINRYVRIKDAEKMRMQQIDPELVLLLLNVAMLLFPVMSVLFLFFVGLPANDVYFYSYPSFILMLGLLIQKRRTFWPDETDKTTIPPDSQLPSLIKITRSYTVVLSVLAILAILFLSLKIILMVNPPQEYTEPFYVNLPLALIYALLIIGCILTIISRLRNSQQAVELTALTSLVLAYWIPFGTAAYIYWRMKIKPKELLKNINAN
jgi:hypothetical protein